MPVTIQAKAGRTEHSKRRRIAMLAHSFLYWVKCNGYFAKLSPDKIETLSEFKRAFNSLNTADSLAWVAANNDKFRKYFKENRKRVY